MIPETLVKLANLGTTGVCVLIIFVVGTAIFKLPRDTPKAHYRLLYAFLVLCVLIAGISAATGFGLARYNQQNQKELITTLKSTQKTLAEIGTNMAALQAKVDSVDQTVQKLPSPDARQAETEVKNVKHAAKDVDATVKKANADIIRQLARSPFRF